MGMEQYRMRMHHVGIVLPTIEAAKEVMDIIGAEVDYTGYVKAYTADLIFTKYGAYESPIEFIIPRGGVLAEYNKGKGGIAHIFFQKALKCLKKKPLKVRKTSSSTFSVPNIRTVSLLSWLRR